MRAPRKSKIKVNGVYGIATNDAEYQVQIKTDGKITWRCPYYERWADMLKRCYSTAYHKRNQSYIGCTVCDEWLLFSNFKSWMESRDWQGKELDKDILFVGNKIYSPEKCVFVHKKVNLFTTERSLHRGEWPLGVDFKKQDGKFRSKCHNPFTMKGEHLGYFDDPNEAHLVWKKRKHELACQLADSEYVDDKMVAYSLALRYT
jgi:hypothetical protein